MAKFHFHTRFQRGLYSPELIKPLKELVRDRIVHSGLFLRNEGHVTLRAPCDQDHCRGRLRVQVRSNEDRYKADAWCYKPRGTWKIREERFSTRLLRDARETNQLTADRVAEYVLAGATYDELPLRKCWLCHELLKLVGARRGGLKITCPTHKAHCDIHYERVRRIPHPGRKLR